MNNKNIKMMVIGGLACVTLCMTVTAAPKGGNGGRAPQKAPAHQQVQRQTQPAQGPGGGHTAKVAPATHKTAPTQHKATPARNRTAPVQHKAAHRAPAPNGRPAIGGHPERHEVVKHEPPRPARHIAPPPRPHYTVRHHWTRPACPPPRYGALRAWTWIEDPWEMIIDGVCYYGDGYYYDGYNYYYNGAYYTTPPMETAIIACR